jgi:hypothetical protein
MRLGYRAQAAVILAFFSNFASPQERQEAPPRPQPISLDVRAFRPAEGPKSGPAVYYEVIQEDTAPPMLRGSYRPGLDTVSMGVEIPEGLKQRARKLRWRWRPRAFPSRGDECQPGRGDSAASVSVAFKRGLKWYVLKYVWSTTGPMGAVCDRKRTIFLARDTIVLESGGKPGTWLTEMIDVRKSFIDHFADGDANASVPDFVGVAVMTDGDQTQSESSADWSSFELIE